MELPEEFRQHMRTLLGDEEFDSFISVFDDDREREYGLRRNPLKADRDRFEAAVPFRLETAGWADEGYYYDPDERPGKSPFHEAGAYYIQEPSAMAVVPLLDPMPGETVCDLCAAPGGKSTQIAGRMGRSGLLVSNEIISGRAEILSQNIERMGIGNCVVTNETPQKMSLLFPAFFDRILVDAPCSGEGMFRKDDTAVREWSMENVAMCAQRQLMILDCAAQMLKPGGRLVYSTCTFEPAEDEMTAAAFLKGHPGWTTGEAVCVCGEEHGRSEWGLAPEYIPGTVRIWPHHSRGEGHFAAVFEKPGELTVSIPAVANDRNRGRSGADAGSTECAVKMLKAVCGKEAAETVIKEHNFIFFGKNIYAVPSLMKTIKDVQVKRPGLQMAVQNDKGNSSFYMPAHALAMYLKPEEALRSYQMDETETVKFMRGESIRADAGRLEISPGADADGWVLMAFCGFSAGWGKKTGAVIKNHYPKGLRREL